MFFPLEDAVNFDHMFVCFVSLDSETELTTLRMKIPFLRAHMHVYKCVCVSECLCSISVRMHSQTHMKEDMYTFTGTPKLSQNVHWCKPGVDMETERE